MKMKTIMTSKGAYHLITALAALLLLLPQIAAAQFISDTTIISLHDEYNIHPGNLLLHRGGSFSLPAEGGQITFSTTEEETVDLLNDYLQNLRQDSLMVVTGVSTTSLQNWFDYTATIQPNHTTNRRWIQITNAVGLSEYFVLIIQAAGTGIPGPLPNPEPTEDTTAQEELYPDLTPLPAQDAEILTNWIKATTYTSASPTESAGFISDIVWYNGIGQPKQTIQIKAGAVSGRNIVTPVMYDPLGRASIDYLPYVSSTGTTAEQESLPVRAQLAWWQNICGASETAPYSDKVLEASSNRILKEYGTGSVFMDNDRYAGSSFLVNTAADSIPFIVVSNSLISSGFYPAGKLIKTVTQDADGRQKTVFTDNAGQIVLERAHLSVASHNDTQYIRDDKGDLAWVITPEGSTHLTASTIWTKESDNALKYCYIYTYDGKGRMTEKQLPGQGTEITIYDPAGRAVAVQDAILRAQNQWKLTRYDSLGRAVRQYLTGVVTRAQMESYFSTSAYPAIYSSTSNILLAEYQYGSTAPTALAFSPVTGVVTSSDLYSNTTGLKTYEKIADISTLSSPTVLYTQRAFYYDIKGRARQTVELMPATSSVTAICRTSANYDFIGNTLTTVESCTQGNRTDTFTQTFTYDSRGRKLTATANINGSTAANITYAYDDLGKLHTTTVGQTASGSVATTRTDSYNIQGWITQMSAQQGTTNIYTQQLRYYNPMKGTTALYSGNISEWSVQQGTNPQSTYGFSYDANGRLTAANRYQSTSTADAVTYSEKALSYDKNGNILTLNRYGASSTTPENNYTYTYSGNRLTILSGTGASEDSPTASTTVIYTYDANGNTTHDGRKNIDLTYDLNGLLQTVSKNSTTKATYHYLADGTKYKTIAPDGTGRMYAGSMTYNIAGSGATITSLDGADLAGGEGRIIAEVSGTTTTYKPIYYLKDHLGSIRTILNAQGEVIERNDYYPLGMRTTTGNTYPTFISTTTSNRYLYNGKEKQTIGDVNYLDYGTRMYDESIGRWTTQDPLSEKYYSQSQYIYCANSPIVFVDPTGNKIRATTKDAQRMILNTLPKNTRQYISFDKSGLVNQKGLADIESKSGNFNSLRTMALSNDYTVNVTLDTKYEYSDKEGNDGVHQMNYNGVDEYFIGNVNGKGEGTSTGETGLLGKTLFPDKNGLENSKDASINVVINSRLSEEGRAQMYSHEANGHAFIYLNTNGNRSAASHNPKNGN